MNFKKEALSILEKIYSGSNHIGDVYNQEALDALYQLHLEGVRENILTQVKDYQHGFIRDDGTGEPERAPEWQVIEDLLSYLETAQRDKLNKE